MWASGAMFAALGMQYRFFHACEGFLDSETIGVLEGGCPPRASVMTAFHTAIVGHGAACLRELVTNFADEDDGYGSALLYAAETAVECADALGLRAILEGYTASDEDFARGLASVGVRAARDDFTLGVEAILDYYQARPVLSAHGLSAATKMVAAAVASGSTASFNLVWSRTRTCVRQLLAPQLLPMAAAQSSAGVVAVLLRSVAGTRGDSAVLSAFAAAQSRPDILTVLSVYRPYVRRMPSALPDALHRT